MSSEKDILVRKFNFLHEDYISEQKKCFICDDYSEPYYYFGEYNIYRYEYYIAIINNFDFKFCTLCDPFTIDNNDKKLKMINWGLNCISNCVEKIYDLGIISIYDLCENCLCKVNSYLFSNENKYNKKLCQECKINLKIYKHLINNKENNIYICMSCFSK